MFFFSFHSKSEKINITDEGTVQRVLGNLKNFHLYYLSTLQETCTTCPYKYKKQIFDHNKR